MDPDFLAIIEAYKSETPLRRGALKMSHGRYDSWLGRNPGG